MVAQAEARDLQLGAGVTHLEDGTLLQDRYASLDLQMTMAVPRRDRQGQSCVFILCEEVDARRDLSSLIFGTNQARTQRYLRLKTQLRGSALIVDVEIDCGHALGKGELQGRIGEADIFDRDAIPFGRKMRCEVDVILDPVCMQSKQAKHGRIEKACGGPGLLWNRLGLLVEEVSCQHFMHVPKRVEVIPGDEISPDCEAHLGTMRHPECSGCLCSGRCGDTAAAVGVRVEVGGA